MESIELKTAGENPEICEECTTDSPLTSIITDRANNFGPDGQLVKCPHCRCEVRTKIVAKPTKRTHCCALLLCCLLCWPCVCIPYLMKSWNDINHYCPICDTFLGTYRS